MECGKNISTSEEDNSCITAREMNGLHLKPVPRQESGLGLPYAPENWPNPGDTWTWKVGKRVRPSGYYQDRYLIAPERLQEAPSRKMWFLSKKSLEFFIRTNFPEADINAFFLSFVWEIPASPSSEGEAEVEPHSQPPVPLKDAPLKACRIDQGGTSSRKRKSNMRQQGPQYLWKKVHSNITNTEVPNVSVVKEENIEINETQKELESSFLESVPASDDNATISPPACHQEPASSLEESPVEVTPEDFDSYINSLDDLLFSPFHQSPTISFGSWREKEMTEARKKLVNLIHIGFPALLTSDKLTEVTTLSLELQNDPNLSARELSMLKLVQEIPSASNDFLEAKQVSAEAEKFFSDLEAKLTHVSTLRNEYNDSKQEIALLEVEDISTSSDIREIDDKIANLLSRRAALTKVADRTNTKIAKAKSNQRAVMDHLPKIVDEIQVANSQSSEWKIKKQQSAEKEVEILTKFAPLKGFCFH